jgi:hypothetical protein
MALTQVTSSMLEPSAQYTGFKNRIINGAFQIAQRSTGASATPSAGTTSYIALDRWFIAQTGTTASLFCGQTTPQTAGVYKAGYFGRNSGQTNVPSTIFFGQQFESFNVYDLRGQSAILSFNSFRGANAPTSLKCVVRFGTTADQSSSSGLTGGWTGYSASTASDFTVDTTVGAFTKTVDVPANASEMMVLFYYTPTGTAGANEWFAFENVQLEKGSTATSFDYRPYGAELALCQRYAYLSSGPSSSAYVASSTLFRGIHFFPVTMRTNPTLTLVTAGVVVNPVGADAAVSSIVIGNAGVNSCLVGYTCGTLSGVSAGMSASANSTILFSSEL